MKQILSLFLFCSFSIGAMAQSCVPDQSYANAEPGVYPEAIATVDCSNMFGSKTIVSLTDTIVSVTNPIVLDVAVYFDSSRVVSASGLPTGLTFGTDVNSVTNAANPYGAWENGGSGSNVTPAVGCVYVTGDSTAWANAAASGVNGIHTLSFEYDARIGLTEPDVSAFGVGSGTWLSALDPSLGGGTITIQVLVDASPTNPNPLDPTVLGETEVDPSPSYNYTAVAGATSYVWSVTGGTIQSGQGTNQIAVIWDGVNNTGNVEVTISNGTCELTGNLAITSISIGITEANLIKADVYPNPSKGIFNVALENSDAISIRVFDLTGKVLETLKYEGSTIYNLDLQALPVGVYLLEIENSEGRAFKRLIKN